MLTQLNTTKRSPTRRFNYSWFSSLFGRVTKLRSQNVELDGPSPEMGFETLTSALKLLHFCFWFTFHAASLSKGTSLSPSIHPAWIFFPVCVHPRGHHYLQLRFLHRQIVDSKEIANTSAACFLLVITHWEIIAIIQIALNAKFPFLRLRPSIKGKSNEYKKSENERRKNWKANNNRVMKKSAPQLHFHLQLTRFDIDEWIMTKEVAEIFCWETHR